MGQGDHVEALSSDLLLLFLVLRSGSSVVVITGWWSWTVTVELGSAGVEGCCVMLLHQFALAVVGSWLDRGARPGWAEKDSPTVRAGRR